MMTPMMQDTATWRCKAIAQILLNGIVLRQSLGEDRAEQEKHYDSQPEHSSFVAQEAPDNFFCLTMAAYGYGVLS